MSDTEQSKRGINLRPSNAIESAKPLDLSDKKLRASIVGMGLTRFTQSFYQPPADDDAYLPMRLIPIVWGSVARKQSLGHLFLMALETAKQDKNLMSLLSVKSEAERICFESGDEMRLAWLRTRPVFEARYVCDSTRWKFPTWSVSVKNELGILSRDASQTMRQMAIIYSTKAILDGKIDVGGFKESLSKNVNEWTDFLKAEKAEISAKFSLI